MKNDKKVVKSNLLNMIEVFSLDEYLITKKVQEVDNFKRILGSLEFHKISKLDDCKKLATTLVCCYNSLKDICIYDFKIEVLVSDSKFILKQLEDIFNCKGKLVNIYENLKAI